MRGDVCAGGCQLSLGHRLICDWPRGTFQLQWAASLVGSIRNQALQGPHLQRGGSLKSPS